MSETLTSLKPISATSSSPLTPNVQLAGIDLTRPVGDQNVRVSAAALAAGVLTAPELTGIATFSSVAALALTSSNVSQSTGAVIEAQLTVVTVCPPGSAVVLSQGGTNMTILNQSANVLTVFPAAGTAIDANSVNAPVGIAPGGQAIFSYITSTQVISE